MYALVFHVPTMIRMHGSLKQFSGQGNYFIMMIQCTLVKKVFVFHIKYGFVQPSTAHKNNDQLSVTPLFFLTRCGKESKCHCRYSCISQCDITAG